jgi:hypothetical protein
MDMTLIQEPSGALSLHNPDCADVLRARAAGWPLMTMFGVERFPLSLSRVAMAGCLAQASGDGEPAPAAVGPQ